MKRDDNKRNAPQAAIPERSHHLFTLTARSEEAVRQAVLNLQRHLEREPQQRLGDLAYTLHVGQRPFDHRLTLVAGNREELAEICTLAADSEWDGSQAGIAYGEIQSKSPARVVFLFNGQGAQYSGMGRELYESSSVFKEVIDECAELLAPHLPLSLHTYLFDPALADSLEETQFMLPTLFVVQVALAKMWMSWGIQPELMIGHSFGEYAAVYLAGGLSLSDALELVVMRGRLLTKRCEPASMLSVLGSEEMVQSYLVGHEDELWITSINGADQIVVSGRDDAIEKLMETLKANNVVNRRLSTNRASHCPLIEPMVDEFRACLSKLTFAPLQIPLVNNMNGELMTGRVLDADYWIDHLRLPVRFQQGMATVALQDVSVVLEVGPHAVLTRLAKKSLRGDQLAVPTLKRDQHDWQMMLDHLGQLWSRGVEVDWLALDKDYRRKRVHVPSYPFERKSYWIHEDGNVTESVAIQAPRRPSAGTAVDNQRAAKKRATLQTGTQQVLAMFWQEVLGVDNVGQNSDFFKLGGDSLNAIQVQTRIRETLGLQVELKNLFEHTTLEQLAAYLDEQRGTPDTPQQQSVIPRLGKQEQYVLSNSQHRMWFFEQMQPGTSTYNVYAAVRFEGQLDVGVLEQCIAEIVKRHDALRSRFLYVGDDSVVIVDDTIDNVPLTVHDLQHLPENEREERAMELALSETQRPFDLETGPLLRTTLMQTTAESYLFVVNMHHIVSDGWSIGVFIREFKALYEMRINKNESALPALPVQYQDYAHWQREWLASDNYTKQLSYWKDKLGGNLPTLQLPTDKPRPAVQTYNGTSHTVLLPKRLAEELSQYGKQAGATLYMILLAAFKTLLYRYTGESDLVVGTPVANRKHRELEDMIGFFVNTLALRTEVQGDVSFAKLLEDVKQVTLEAFAHQDMPFDKLVEELKLDRDPAFSPLFQTLFILQNAPTGALQAPGMTITPLELTNAVAKFDLTLMMVETAEGLIASFEYNTDLFAGSTIERMSGHFEHLLEAILTQPDQQVSKLPLLTDSERQDLLVLGDEATDAFLQELCIHELVERQAAQTPDRLAVVHEETSLTYRELNARANQLAHHLRVQGVGPEVLVGINVERSLDMVVGMLGILKAGGAYVPLDPAYPADRLGYILEDAKASVLLTQESLLGRLPDHEAEVICLDRDWSLIEASAASILENETFAQPNNLAYLIYTSGSTGRPKGVAIEHRNAVALIEWAQGVYSPEQLAGVLASTSICFDLSVFELFVTLSTGGKVILAENALHLPNLPVREEVTLINTVPSAITELVRMEGIPKSVRTINLAGEPLHRALAERIYEVETVERVYNLYGPSEDTTYSTFTLVERGEEVTIGRPIAGTQAYVLDANEQLVPMGVPGELHLGGDGLARGYLNREDLTAAKFIANPFSANPKARLYKTGDLVRFRADGSLEYLGRIDHQVKIRGFRIELGEIEEVLASHPSVAESVVIAREDEPGVKRLVAYFVADASEAAASLDVGELRRHLKEKLPDYMIPAAFVQMEQIPLTANGKTDRRALPKPDHTRPELESTFEAPRTWVESQLVEIWSTLLRVEQVGIHDNFFELGGDSILILQMVARAKQAGIQMQPKQLFEHQTIGKLAAVVGTSTVISAEQGIVTGDVPLTPIQHWFFEQDLPDLHHWNQAVLLSVNTALPQALLAGAMDALLRQHDALRLRFTRTENGWSSYIADVEEVQVVQTYDLSAMGEEDQSRIIEMMTSSLQKSFDLTTGPLIRVVAFDLGQDRPGRFFMVAHHLVIDGVSWRVLLEDLQTAMEQLKQGQSVQLPPKTTSFKQWSERLLEYVHSGALENERAYWSEVAQTPVAPLPLDEPAGVNREGSARDIVVGLTQEETKALLQEVPAAYNTQVNDVLLTAMAKVLSEFADSSAVRIDLEGHGREDLFADVDVSRTVGWFTSLYPVLFQLDGVTDPGERLKRVKEQLRNIPNRGIGYGLLRYLSGEDQDNSWLSEATHADVIFNYLGQLDQAIDEGSAFGAARESSGRVHGELGNRQYLLDVNSSISAGVLQVQWTYSDHLHRQETIEKLALAYVEELRRLIAHCQDPQAGGYTPSDFPKARTTQEDLDKLLAEIGSL